MPSADEELLGKDYVVRLACRLDCRLAFLFVRMDSRAVSCELVIAGCGIERLATADYG